jgi:hypothetical protein
VTNPVNHSTSTKPKGKSHTNAKGVYFDIKTGASYTTKATVDCVYFDSRFELRVYQLLRHYFRREAILIHHPLLIKPGTERYAPLYWKIDFVVDCTINGNGKQLMLIEAKGIRFPDFKRNVQYLEYFQASMYQRLLVVGEHQPERVDKVLKTITMSELERQIKQVFLTNYK